MKLKFSLGFINDYWIVGLLASVVFLSLINLWVAWRQASTGFEVVPLHYNIYFGVDWFGSVRWLYLYPGLSFVISIINTVLAQAWYSKSRAMSYLFLGVALICAVLFLLASILIGLENSF